MRFARIRLVARFDSSEANSVVKTQRCFRSRDAVDVCAIGRIEIFQLVSFTGKLQLRVMTRDRRIGNNNHIIRAASNRDQIFDEFMRDSSDD